APIAEYLHLDAAAGTAPAVSLMHVANAPGERVVLGAMPSLRGDTDDVRCYADAAGRALARGRAAGMRRPIVFVESPLPPTSGATARMNAAAKARLERDYVRYVEVALLGMLQEAYTPLQAREWLTAQQKADLCQPFKEIGVAMPSGAPEAAFASTLRFVDAVERGRALARDVGGSDPERMSPQRCATHIREALAQVADCPVSYEALTDQATLEQEYPLLTAVTRASDSVPRHAPVVVTMRYASPDPSAVKENLFLVGKGVTYDTGGLDVKTGGAMRGMSRDKLGAAAVAGLMLTTALLRPTRVNIVAHCCFVRNSCGANGYVDDEVLVSRAGVRVLVGCTDAEGRMIMADALHHAKQEALALPATAAPAKLFTVATLTGHVIRAYGPYMGLVPNGVAREDGTAARLDAAAHVWGDPAERSSLRREDYALIAAPADRTADVLQANTQPSTLTPRGHQYPAAFLAVASGLDRHGLDSAQPLAYVHMDIAGSAECSHPGGTTGLPRTTGSPIAALVGTF
ncbi:hypothetical protein CXG81DRAFT_5608, partial [Caulochytrium protostelioides]